MRSPRGLAASVVFLLALPVAALHQMVFGDGVEAVIHVVLAAGSLLMSFAVFDFKTTKWITWIGCASTGAIGAVFLLQGLSEMVHSESFAHFVYQILGQRLEGWLFDLFLLWCIAVLLVDSRGKTRILGIVAMSAVVCFEAYELGLSYRGVSLGATAPSLKVLSLLPFVWLLFESKKKVAEARNDISLSNGMRQPGIEAASPSKQRK